MLIDELTALYNPWNMLQQPRHASSSAHASFRALLAAIDQGWQVVEPVQVLPIIQADAWTYYFVLTHTASAEIYRLFVPALPEVERYVEQNRYQVIESSVY
jgi:hypothetical protein